MSEATQDTAGPTFTIARCAEDQAIAETMTAELATAREENKRLKKRLDFRIGEVVSLEAALGRVTAALRTIGTVCIVRFGNHPDSFTCLDYEAEYDTNPSKFGDPLATELRERRNRCRGCIARAALASLGADDGAEDA